MLEFLPLNMNSYSIKKDSIYFFGQLSEKASKYPIVNMNVEVKGFKIGTVPDSKGNFVLLLPKEKGTLIFNKAGFERFEFKFNLK